MLPGRGEERSEAGGVHRRCSEGLDIGSEQVNYLACY